MNPDSLIHLRVPSPLKGRWVRASRAQGLTLTDWIINAVESQMDAMDIQNALNRRGAVVRKEGDAWQFLMWGTSTDGGAVLRLRGTYDEFDDAVDAADNHLERIGE